MPEPRIDPTKSRSVVETPSADDNLRPGGGTYTYFISSAADWIEPWGRDWERRDQQLREFFPNESFIAGAIYSIGLSNANFRWELDGPPRTTEQIRILLNTANRGKGWVNFVQKLTLDLLTQDNGAFIEFMRMEDSENSPVVGLGNLDAAKCWRTGDPLNPVVYTNRKNKRKLLKWYQVCAISECPSNIESMYDLQYCGLSRVLRMAQILKDLATYKAEKVGGRFERALHIIGGPSRKEVEQILTRDHNRATEQGLTRFMLPTILTSLDPEKPVSHVEIPLASMPDGFDYDDEMKWYLAALALGFGRDYQEFAPLPGGGLGTSTQSEILHQKSKAKGPAWFMKMMEYILNFYGVMPNTVTFEYDEIDPEDERMKAETAKIRAETRATQIQSGEITPQMARQIASDAGDLDESLLAMAGEEDMTPNVTVEENEPVDEGEDIEAPENEKIDKPEESEEPEDPEEQKFWTQIFKPETLKMLINRITSGQISKSH